MAELRTVEIEDECDVSRVSEAELLGAFTPLLPRGRRTLLGPGDDCAVLAAGGPLVVTTDVLVEGQHFRREWSSGEDVGRRAAAANLSDVAAMGAEPTALVVGLTLPDGVTVGWVRGLARGLARACEPHGVGVEGGDLTRGDVVVVAVTALGELATAPVLRSGARAGDVVAAAGTFGHSAAGLEMLRAREEGVVLPVWAEALVRVHLVPSPPLEAGPLAARTGASAMLDVSDGLLRDAGRLAAASGVSIDLERRDLSPDVELLEQAAELVGADPLAWVLAGGEDHALLATFPPEGPLPVPFRRIGTVGAGAGVTLDGAAWSGPIGWDHFAS